MELLNEEQFKEIMIFFGKHLNRIVTIYIKQCHSKYRLKDQSIKDASIIDGKFQILHAYGLRGNYFKCEKCNIEIIKSFYPIEHLTTKIKFELNNLDIHCIYFHHEFEKNCDKNLNFYNLVRMFPLK